MNQNLKPESKKSFFKNIDIKKYLTVRNLIGVIAFLLLFLVYYKSEMASRVANKSKDIITILGHQFPYSSFAGCYSAVMTIVLISWVVFYRRFGFCTALIILIIRTIRVSKNLMHSHYHASVLPALFLTFSALVSIILIFVQQEKRQRAIEILYCSPPLRSAPPSPITVSKPFGNFMMKS